MIENIETLVEITELKGRKVLVISQDFEEIEGHLHAITDHGILIKTIPDGIYELFPWWQVSLVRHFPHQVKVKEKKKEELEETLKIEESSKSIITENIPEDYDWEWEDEELESFNINDGSEDVISVECHENKITVYKQEDLNLAMTLAKKLNINKLVKDYGSA